MSVSVISLSHARFIDQMWPGLIHRGAPLEMPTGSSFLQNVKTRTTTQASYSFIPRLSLLP
jgi:hypothetical protein